jgi:hypothetical protein
LKITEEAHIVGLLISTVKVTCILALSKMGAASFWAIFSQTRLVTLFGDIGFGWLANFKSSRGLKGQRKVSETLRWLTLGKLSLANGGRRLNWVVLFAPIPVVVKSVVYVCCMYMYRNPTTSEFTNTSPAVYVGSRLNHL